MVEYEDTKECWSNDDMPEDTWEQFLEKFTAEEQMEALFDYIETKNKFDEFSKFIWGKEYYADKF